MAEFKETMKLVALADAMGRKGGKSAGSDGS
jgi:hypothetical protein